VLGVDGEFRRGDLVEIADASEKPIARGLSQYGAAEVRLLAGRHSREIDGVLGYSYGAEVVHRDDLVTMGEHVIPGKEITA
jgi:glutamate 5-kinase